MFSLRARRIDDVRQTILIRTSLCLCFEELVDLGYKLVRVSSVDLARHFDALAACGGAAETVHAYLEEKLCGLAIKVENLADY